MRVILIGGSKVAFSLARQFSQREYHVTIINEDKDENQDLARNTQATVIRGDGTNVNRLEEAGARRADAVIALTPHDQDNLIACQIANRKFGVPRTIALVNDPENEEVFQRLGVNVAFSATRVIASIIEQETDFASITSLMTLARGRVNVTDVRLERDYAAVGKTLQELQLSGKSLIACVIRGDEMIIPSGATELMPNDHLVLISQPGKQREDLQTLCGGVE